MRAAPWAGVPGLDGALGPLWRAVVSADPRPGRDPGLCARVPPVDAMTPPFTDSPLMHARKTAKAGRARERA
jgi:hypothetical protein